MADSTTCSAVIDFSSARATGPNPDVSPASKAQISRAKDKHRDTVERSFDFLDVLTAINLEEAIRMILTQTPENAGFRRDAEVND
jgi:hypothetical protein